jgi:hypothetical protein
MTAFRRQIGQPDLDTYGENDNLTERCVLDDQLLLRNRYREKIIENGIECRDMIRMEMLLDEEMQKKTAHSAFRPTTKRRKGIARPCKRTTKRRIWPLFTSFSGMRLRKRGQTSWSFLTEQSPIAKASRISPGERRRTRNVMSFKSCTLVNGIRRLWRDASAVNTGIFVFILCFSP